MKLDTSPLHLDLMIALGYRAGHGRDICRLRTGVSRETRQHEHSQAMSQVTSHFDGSWRTAVESRVYHFASDDGEPWPETHDVF